MSLVLFLFSLEYLGIEGYFCNLYSEWFRNKNNNLCFVTPQMVNSYCMS